MKKFTQIDENHLKTRGKTREKSTFRIGSFSECWEVEEIIKIRALDSLTATKIDHFHVKNRPHNFNGRVQDFVGKSF
jgi:hypothetical protein